MQLRSLQVKNYLSLEDVLIEDLGQFNVLIGRNNAGKSAVFGALAFLNSAIRGGAGGDELRRVTGQDRARSLEMDLRLELGTEERAAFVDHLASAGGALNRAHTLNSRAASEVRFHFRAPPGAPHTLNLSATHLLASNGQWAQIQALHPTATSPPTHEVVRISDRLRNNQGEHLSPALLDIKEGGYLSQVSVNPASLVSVSMDGGLDLLLRGLTDFLGDSFFFGPFRSVSGPTGFSHQPRLTPNGANLATVLATTNLNDRERYNRIEAWVHAALPDVGQLQTPSNSSNHVEVGFNSAYGRYFVPLDKMGGGVQQLLLVATSLFTTEPGGALFLEEPESNLHPGAQRYLIEQLLGSGRQVFIAIHSPLFVNLGDRAALFRLTRAGGRTSVERVSSPEQLGATLEDIGARNSDVLLSDGVLFVEGDTERDCFLAWGDTLGHGLTRRNVTVLPMGGGAHASRGAPARSQVLEEIAHKTTLPHLFLVDSDERCDAEVERLNKNDRVRVLSVRELENLFLRPALIRRQFLAKYEHEKAIRAKLEGDTDEALAAAIAEEADKLFELVLLKRIKAELGGLADGLLPREAVARLLKNAGNPDLPAMVESEVHAGLTRHLEEVDVKNLVVAQQGRLRKEWVKPEDRLKLAPGEEVLCAVFKRYGGKFDKRHDGPAMAKLMTAAEVPAEIKTVIEELLAQLPG